MSITVPVRRLGSAGIVSDIAAAELDDTGQPLLSSGAFNKGKNVRFRNGSVTRGPVARTVAQLDFEPGHVLTIPPSASGYDEIVVVSQDFGSIARVNGRFLETLAPEDHQPAEGRQAITSSFLGGVSYLNRESHRPLAKRPGDTLYGDIGPAWPENWTAKVIRPYRDSLIALGVTMDGQYYPTKVVWSNPVLFGQLPTSFTAEATNSAGESTSNSMQHRIVDGLELRESFMIYCTNSVWVMEYIGGDFLYGWRKVWDERGMIAPNCVVQVGGEHYVFDRSDIWMHNGISDKSLCEGKVKDRIFRELDYSRSDLCFVSYDPKLSEVRFNYPSKADDVAYVNPETGCNRAAVYNYANGTWTFDDVPNVTGAARSAILTGGIFDEPGDELTFDDDAGLFDSAEGDDDRHSLYVGRSFASQGLTAPRLYGYDLLTGGRLTIPPEPEALQDSYVERTGIDLDSIGKNLKQTVRLQTVWPQCTIEHPQDASWEFGANNLVTQSPIWSDPMVFDPLVDERLYLDATGKYLSYRFRCGGAGDFILTSFDVELNIRGRR